MMGWLDSVGLVLLGVVWAAASVVGGLAGSPLLRGIPRPPDPPSFVEWRRTHILRDSNE